MRVKSVCIGLVWSAAAWGNGVADTSWVEVGKGLPDSCEVISLLADGDALFAGTIDHGLYVTRDQGANWKPSMGGTATVMSLVRIGKTLLAAADNGLSRSEDSGKGWTKVPAAPGIQSLLVREGRIYAGTLYAGVSVSDDSGKTWAPLGTGFLANQGVYGVAIQGDYIYAGTNKGIFRAGTKGSAWDSSNTGLPSNHPVFSVAAFGNTLLAGTLSKIYRSTDAGGHWTRVNPGVTDVFDTYGFLSVGADLYAATGNVKLVSTVLVSHNDGAEWLSTPKLSQGTVRALAVANGYLYAGVTRYRVWRLAIGAGSGVRPRSPTTRKHPYSRRYHAKGKDWSLLGRPAAPMKD